MHVYAIFNFVLPQTTKSIHTLTISKRQYPFPHALANTRIINFFPIFANLISKRQYVVALSCISLITSGEHSLNKYLLCLLVGAERTEGNRIVSLQESFLCELL